MIPIKYTFFKGAVSISEWCRAENVLTTRFQQPLHWFEASTKKISTMSFSSPWSPLLFVLASIRSHLSRQLTETKADHCSLRSGSAALPSPLTCAAPKGGWIMEECSQEGIFSLSQTSVCMELLQSPTQQVRSPKRCPTAYRNIDVQLRFRCRKCSEFNNLAVVEVQNTFLSGCLDTAEVLVSDSDNYAPTMWLLMNNLLGKKLQELK